VRRRTRFITALLAGALVVASAGCDADSSEDSTQAVAATAAQGTRAAPGRVTEIATGLEMPWGLAFLPNGSALVSSRSTAQIHHVRASGGEPRLVGRVRGVEQSSEGGLLGLATSPEFASDRTVYAYVSASPTNRVVALRVGRGLRSLRQTGIVLDGIATADRHHGGRIQFGPDGNLWIGTGDAYTDPEISQDPDGLNGKVLRIRPDGTIPPDNPFDSPVYTLGHRNVQGLAYPPSWPPRH
jgi:glucose/arabinose dehydrogenase